MALELSVIQVSLASYRVLEYRNFREAEIPRAPFLQFFAAMQLQYDIQHII